MNLQGATVVITGGGGGLGLDMARTFAGLGARIGALDRDSLALERLAEAVPDAQSVPCDVTDPAGVDAAFGELSERLGRIHVLVNNAGLLFSAPLLSVGPEGLVAHSVEDWERVRAVTLDGVFYATRSAAERMVRTRTKGVIVNISSVSAAGNVGQGAYSAAKAGVEALTVTWAKELGPWGIRVAGVAPGYTETPSTRAAVPERHLEEIAGETALKRLGKPSEITAAVRFLIENDFVTGTTVKVDGGIRV